MELVLSGLRLARGPRRPAPGLIPHSDLSSWYAAGEYPARCTPSGMVAGMSAKGDRCDNAVAEGFFSTLEFELLVHSDWQARAEAGGCSSVSEFWYTGEAAIPAGLRQPPVVRSTLAPGGVRSITYASIKSGQAQDYRPTKGLAPPHLSA